MLERLRAGAWSALAPVLDAATAAADRRRQDDAAARAEAEERLLIDKGWNAMGAFDPAERSHVVDLLGVDGQLVFATFATAMFMGRDLDLLYAGSAAHNRAVADFCEDDPRLLPVAFVPLRRHRAGRPAGHRGDRPRLRGRARPVDGRGRPVAHPSRPRPVLVGAERPRRAVRAARRRRRAPARPGLPRQRPPGHRPPRRRREHPLQGLPRHLELAVAVPRRADPRRAVRPVPRACAAASSRRGRAGSCRGCTSSTSPSGPSGAPRSR